MSLRRRPLVGVLAVFSLTGLLHGTATRTETHTFQISPGDTLIVSNDYGSVRIRVRDEPQAQVRIRRNGADETRLAEVQTVAQKNDDKLFLQAYFYDFRGESVAFDITVPSTVNLWVSGANPAVEIEELEGWVRVHTLTGAIRGTNLRGAVSLQTERGDVEFRSEVQPFREIRLETVTGSVVCRIAQGLDMRAWTRAGGTLNWNDEIQLQPGKLEKQLGQGGPLIYAGSLQGDVTFILGETGLPVLAKRRPAVPERRPEDIYARQRPELDEGRSAPSQNSDEEVYDAAGSQPRKTDRDGKAPATAGGQDEVYTAAGPEGDVGGMPSFKVEVNWINLNVSVRDRRTNRSIPALKREDFLVYEDGVEQAIERFESTEAPINLLLLLDVSGSTESYIDLIRRASIDFTNEIKANDRIAVAIFNSRVRLLQRFTNDRRQVAQRIRGIRSDGGTAFYDALWTSIHEYMGQVEGRKAIVVFSDGIDNQLTGGFGSGSRVTFPELFRSVQEADTIIYPIFLETNNGSAGRIRINRGGGVIDILEDIMAGRRGRIPGIGSGDAQEEARRQMEAIAEQTGGRMYSPRRVQDLSGVYSQIADDLRVQYTLVYASNNPGRDGRWRTIDVRVRDRRDWVARTRRGYYAVSGPDDHRSHEFNNP